MEPKPSTAHRLYSAAAISARLSNGKTSTARKVEEVPTELKLFCNDDFHVVTKKAKVIEEPHDDDDVDVDEVIEEPHDNDDDVDYQYLLALELERKQVENRLKSFRVYSRQDEEEERSLGVSTKLKLFEDPWKIKKKLMKSDINGLCRLLLSTDVVLANIIPFMDADRVAEITSEAGTMVVVVDYDSGSHHQLVFKRWKSNHSYVFTKNWSAEFVRRRKLQEGDEIGLFWDSIDSRFGFRVLARASHH